MQIQKIFSVAQEAMGKTIHKLKTELSSIRTGRANSSIIEGIKVESYGALMSINQIASIVVSDAKTVEIKPWDTSQLNVIEKAILKANLGVTLVNDGKIIRVSVPSLTEETRKEIVKSVVKMAEDFKIAIRNERRDLVENIKALEKDGIITEDDKKKFEVEAQKITDNYVKKIDEIIINKEKEIMSIVGM